MRGIPALAILLTLAACAPQAAPDVDDGELVPLYEGLPEGTAQTGTDLYMVPLSELDKDGCQAYRQYSPTMLVTMAIYYRDSEGGFTANKMQATCYAKN